MRTINRIQYIQQHQKNTHTHAHKRSVEWKRRISQNLNTGRESAGVFKNDECWLGLHALGIGLVWFLVPEMISESTRFIFRSSFSTHTLCLSPSCPIVAFVWVLALTCYLTLDVAKWDSFLLSAVCVWVCVYVVSIVPRAYVHFMNYRQFLAEFGFFSSSDFFLVLLCFSEYVKNKYVNFAVSVFFFFGWLITNSMFWSHSLLSNYVFVRSSTAAAAAASPAKKCVIRFQRIYF